MQDENMTKIEFAVPVSAGLSSLGAGGLSPLEIERTRVFFKQVGGSNPYGSITDLKWTITYHADNTGTVSVSFTESIKAYLVSGNTSVALLDANNTALVRWDIAFWRQCGTRVISFSQPIDATIGERTTGMNFEVNGNARQC